MKWSEVERDRSVRTVSSHLIIIQSTASVQSTNRAITTLHINSPPNPQSNTETSYTYLLYIPYPNRLLTLRLIGLLPHPFSGWESKTILVQVLPHAPSVLACNFNTSFHLDPDWDVLLTDRAPGYIPDDAAKIWSRRILPAMMLVALFTSPHLHTFITSTPLPLLSDNCDAPYPDHLREDPHSAW